MKYFKRLPTINIKLRVKYKSYHSFLLDLNALPCNINTNPQKPINSYVLASN